MNTMDKAMVIALMATGAACAQVRDEGWRYVVAPESVEKQAGGAVLVRYDLKEVPLARSLNSVIWYKAAASGEGSNPAFAVWAVDGEGNKVERVSEVTIKPDTDGPIPFPVSEYVDKNLKGGKIAFLIEPRALPGFSQAVEFSGQPWLSIAKAQVPAYDLPELLRPVWKGSRMVNETALPTSYEGKLAEANLAFVPSKIISVKNHALDTAYEEGKDFVVDGRTLRLVSGSAIPFLRYDELYHDNPDAKPNVMKTVDGGYLTFSESAFFNDKQLAVTYEHAQPWDGPVPQPAKKRLPKTFKKLEAGAPLKLVVFGDSISVGASASGKAARAPWMPRWADLVADELERKFGSKIDYMHGYLLENKTYWDMTGNHVNHPNDFLVRTYAQTLLGRLGVYE